MKETNPKSIDNSGQSLSTIPSASKNEIFKVNQKKGSNSLNEFEHEASNIFFIPISCKENFSGNYDNYIKLALNHISCLQNLPFEKALNNEKSLI